MRTLAGAALGALILTMAAAPAMAGGYWDGASASREGDSPPPAYHHGDRDCPPCPCWRDHQARDDGDRDGGDDRWRDSSREEDEDYDNSGGSVSYDRDYDDSDAGYDNGDAYYDEDQSYEGAPAYGGGGGGGAVDIGFGINFDHGDRFGERERVFDHNRDHQHMMVDHREHQQVYAPHMMQHMRSYTPQRSYMPQRSYRPMQPVYHMQSYSHPAPHMAMHGGGHRW